MTKDELQELFEQEQCRELAWGGKCCVCGADVTVVVRVEDDGQLTISGGAVYHPVMDREGNKDIFLKCDSCYQQDSILRNYRPVTTYSRVVGSYAPLAGWNAGKQAEFHKRTTFAQAG